MKNGQKLRRGSQQADGKERMLHGLNVKPPHDDAKKNWSSLNARPLRIHKATDGIKLFLECVDEGNAILPEQEKLIDESP